MTIDHSGNVGIGTRDPAAQLEISAPSSGHGSTSNIARITAPIYPMLDFYSTNTNSNNRNWKIASVYNSYGTLEILKSSAANGTPNQTVMAMNKDGIVTKPYNPSFNARYPAVTNGGGTTIVFSSTHFNIGSHYNTSNGIFTAPVAGSYLFSFSILIDPSGTNHYARILFARNGTAVDTTLGDSLESSDYDQQQEYQSLQMSAVIYLNANDTMRLQNTGQSPTYGTSYGSFSGYLLG